MTDTGRRCDFPLPTARDARSFSRGWREPKRAFFSGIVTNVGSPPVRTLIIPTARLLLLPGCVMQRDSLWGSCLILNAPVSPPIIHRMA